MTASAASSPAKCNPISLQPKMLPASAKKYPATGGFSVTVHIGDTEPYQFTSKP